MYLFKASDFHAPVILMASSGIPFRAAVIAPPTLALLPVNRKLESLCVIRCTAMKSLPTCSVDGVMPVWSTKIGELGGATERR